MALETFAERFCRGEACSHDQYAHRVFRRCLYPHASLLLGPVGGRFLRLDYFATDRELIEAVANATTLDQVRIEAREFFLDTRNQGWLRRRLNLRVSVGRLLRLAKRHLAD